VGISFDQVRLGTLPNNLWCGGITHPADHSRLDKVKLVSRVPLVLLNNLFDVYGINLDQVSYDKFLIWVHDFEGNHL
jgi:hypothetical protein